ncbi:MAG: hypothetical protein R3277_10285 [Brumimicrobium sp.]|nr:hypothetical protein [Brumimicrobium sp.]
MKTFLLVTIAFFLQVAAFGQDELVNKMNEAKKTLKDDLGDLNYDGSKSTYFQVGDKLTFKEVEVAVFLRDNYHLLFNGHPAPSKVTLRIYDKPAENPDRIMLYEVKNISGKRKTITVEELKKLYAYYVEDPNTLRSVYIDYEIHKGKKARGGIVLVLGY